MYSRGAASRFPVAANKIPIKKRRDTKEFLYGFLTVSSLSELLMYLAVTMTKEKLNVSNNMLGTGIAVMVLGFLMHAIMVLKFIDAGGYWRDGQDFCYAALSIVGLLIGLAGIVLMAVGILKACRDET